MPETANILLVEDNEDDLDLTMRALQKQQLRNRVQVARDGEEALDFMFARNAFAEREVERTPTLVLLDLKLPKVTGLEVLREIKADARTRRTPVVVLTSSREDRDIVSAYELGANSYIVKSVDFDRFIESARILGQYWLMLNEQPRA